MDGSSIRKVSTEFLGYEVINGEGSVELISRGPAEVPVLEEGQDGEVVLNRTTFYPEGGGQIGDRGTIVTPTGRFSVEDTQRLAAGGGIILHRGRVTAGEIQVGQRAEARVDPSHRAGVERSHTATHMIHWALRDRLGEHAHQRGSLVEPGRLRFDFQHFEPVGAETLARIEEEVNRRVLSDDAVHAFETTYDQATALGAMALFGEKYGDYVRVVEVGDYSKELCGGTHVHHTGQVGVIKILGESSVAAGTRRIESYTGIAGLNYLNTQAERLRRASELLRTDPDGVVERLEKLLETSKALEAQISKQKAAGVEDEVKAILGSDDVRPVGLSKLVVLKRDGRSVDELRKLAITLRDRLASAVVALGTALDGKANLVVAEHRVAGIVVGLPISLSGSEGAAAARAREFAAGVGQRLGLPVHLVDERLSTVAAGRALAQAGARGRRAGRKSGAVDRSAAAVILQAWLDSKAGGAGTRTGPGPGGDPGPNEEPAS